MIPYSTADKVRTITLPIVAMIGEANVYVDTNAISVALSNTKAGTLDGFKFTATSDTSITNVDVTITYGETALVYAIEFGKGSEVIYDFEDGKTAGFMGFEEAKQWSIDNNVNNTLDNNMTEDEGPLAGQFNEYLSSTTFVASTTNGGQVRSGNYALAWKLDNTDAAFASWSYNVLFNTGDTIVLRDVANGLKATTLGMWLYIPEEAFQAGTTGVAFQSQLYVKNTDGSFSCKQDHFMFTSAATGNQTNLNSATNADIPDSRWVYATIDISKYDYLCTPIANDEGNSRSPSFIRTYVKPTFPANITFYIDDITLDYSSAVDDRVLPTITNPTYSTSDTAISLENGTTINGTKIAFAATVADNAGLDKGSGKIYVDGVEISASISGSVLSSKEDMVLVPGVHTVTFQVQDALGNPRKLVRTFTVSGDAAVTLTGHNDSGEAAKAQSVYYVDIDVADLTNVKKLVVNLKLNNANTWETEGAVVAAGFEASFRYNDVSELLTVTVEKVSDSNASGNTLVSIPVRVWTFDRYDYVAEEYAAVSTMGNKPVVNIDCDVVYGQVTLADGTTSPIGGSISVATELTTISSPYHEHDDDLTNQEKEANCIETGYAGRTYCGTCKSVVSWGTVVAKKGHSYELVDGKFVCQVEDCGLAYEPATGAFEMNGDLYYSVNGELKTGWQDMDGLYGYAGKDYKMYVNGEYTIDGITYTFANDGTTKGAWTTNAIGTRYSIGPSFIKRSWVTIDGAKYYFGEDNYMYTGTRSIPKNRNNLDEGIYWYLFDENGKYIKDYTDLNGIVEENGNKYWVVNGMNAYGGLMLIDGDYYYARTHGQLVCGKTYWITKNNDLLPVSGYEFGADGKMLNPPATEEPDPTPDPDTPVVPEVKNGITEENGVLYYYEDDAKTYGGLLYLDTDSDGVADTYYYARSSGKLAVNCKYWITKDNGLLPVGYYNFDTDGKMIDPPATEEPDPTPDPDTPVVPEVKNGITEENGVLYYYVDDAKTYGGLLYLDTDSDGVADTYYYARSSGKLAVNCKYWITKDNGLLPVGYYNFDTDGKMIDPPATEEPNPEPDTPVVPEEPEVKNGIVSEDGRLWWYVNDVKTYGGLMLIDGDYYYARTSGEIIAGRSYWITKTNDLLPAAKYTFGADGKMIDPPTT